MSGIWSEKVARAPSDFSEKEDFFRNFPPQNVQGVGNERETNNGTLSALPNHRLCSESCDRKVSLSGPPNERSALQTSRNSFGESILSVAAPFLYFLISVCDCEGKTIAFTNRRAKYKCTQDPAGFSRLLPRLSVEFRNRAF